MRVLALLILTLLLPSAGIAKDRAIILASTTSTQNSGLLDAILPLFEEKTGIKVHVVAVGTGQALRIARNGDADVLLVHHRPSEDAFIAAGWGVDRRDVMYNDFVVVGPKDDPAGVRDARSAAEALTKIAGQRAIFTSRGDESGTHLREREIWKLAGVTPKGDWYRETGAGMGTTLNIASAMDAYVLTDRGTWITFGNKGNLELLYSHDPVLLNPYGVILVNPEKYPTVRAEEGRALMDWLVSDEGQQAIAAFQINGMQAFCPWENAPATPGEDAPICPADEVPVN